MQKLIILCVNIMIDLRTYLFILTYERLIHISAHSISMEINDFTKTHAHNRKCMCVCVYFITVSTSLRLISQ